MDIGDLPPVISNGTNMFIFNKCAKHNFRNLYIPVHCIFCVQELAEMTEKLSSMKHDIYTQTILSAQAREKDQSSQVR